VFFDSTQVRGWNRSDAVAQFGRFSFLLFHCRLGVLTGSYPFDHSLPSCFL
jgi:hypothetical protein